MARATYEGPEQALKLFEAVVDGNPAVERKGAKNPYVSRNGHMFGFLDAEGTLAIRLSDELRAEWAQSHDDGPVMSYGRVMNGYVSVPPQLLANTVALQPWFDASHDWIGTLKPKPTKKPAKKK